MLVLVLLLVVASLGLLIAALTTANTLWAWISVLISVVAAGLLVMDWLKNRRRRSQAANDRTKVAAATTKSGQAISRSDLPMVGDTTVADVLGHQESRPLGPQISRIDLQTVGEQPGTRSDEEWEHVPELDGPLGGAEVTATQPPVADPDTTAVQAPVAHGPVTMDPGIEPAEENTDATDLLVVSELADEVVVIDERPRYHLVACTWLGDRPIMALPVSEARDLGFTPCALCGPDATLAARHRAGR